MATVNPQSSDLPLHEHLRAHARQTPDKPAYLWYGEPITFAQLDAASDAFAAHLQALGVKKGEPVVLFMNNCPQYAMAHYGIQKMGAVVCPCGPLNKEHELEYQLKDLQARVIVAADHLLPLVEKVRARTAVRHVFAVRHGELLPAEPSIDLPSELQAPRASLLPEGVVDFLAVARSGARPTPLVVDMENDLALITYTSGTTGLPKGAMLSHRSALYKTEATVRAKGISADDILLVLAPMYHIAGEVMCVTIPILAGATAVLLHRFDPVAVLQAIERHQVSWWYSVATMNVAVMAVPDAARYRLDSLRQNPVTSFGIAFTEPLALQWQGFAKNCQAMEAAYGLSETHTMDTHMPGDAIRWGTHGKAMDGNHIRIIDPETGTELPANEPGEIVLRSPGVFKGYWNKPEATAQTLRDGWVHTGDMGKMDADGYLTFMGRYKEMIKVSGYSVFPEEVESILIKHPAIAQAAVVSQPDPDKGEVVVAFVVLKAGGQLTEAELVAWSRENMALYKAPRRVRFIDALPSTGAGKLLRRLLKDQL